MGLDMYAFCTREPIPPVDFDCPEHSMEIAYWRKHPNLHGWMHALYVAKGGTDEKFNCNQLRLDLADLDALEAVVLANQLEPHSGFFFGESHPDDKLLDIAFIAAAREAITGGQFVYYTSWW